jgi:hypothetical protein
MTKGKSRPLQKNQKEPTPKGGVPALPEMGDPGSGGVDAKPTRWGS